MAEPKDSGGVCGGVGESSRASPKLVTAGDRQLLTVELRPGETTYVSWKKLMKDANKVNGSSASVPDPPPNANPNLESRIAPGHPAEGESVDQPHPNRFSAVIEKIERLYMGKDSSDGEELDSSPDDDEYDTEDSFIDDAELDEYFEVDNSAIKHDGFFVNRGKLERICEPSTKSNQQPKKRQRKDTAKSCGDIVDVSIKQAKVAKMAGGKVAPSLAKKNSIHSQSLSMTTEYVNTKVQNQSNASGQSSKKKYADAKTAQDSFSSFKVPSGDASLSTEDVKHTDKTNHQPKNVTSHKLKEVGSSDALHQKYRDKSVYQQSSSQPGKSSHNNVLAEAAVHQKEKNGMHDLANANMSGSRQPIPATKAFPAHKRDGSNVRPKTSMLEKAIRELEKVVAESRPPAAVENQEADVSSQAVKRRLPREVKLKLAKVARIAASQGKLSTELINRLMSIVGHLIQLRSLKRNLKIMIDMGMSANREKDDRFQQIKKEVIEMIKTRVPLMESQATEQQVGTSDDFQDAGSVERPPSKKKFVMDVALEDKICDLYDLFVDGLDDDAGPQIRKLYVELAELWPHRLMDNHGIKRAICRAKERRRVLYGKEMDQEKMKKRKHLVQRSSEETVRPNTALTIQQQYSGEKMAVDPNATAASLVRMPSPPVIDSLHDRSKQQHEKLKGSLSSGNSAEETKKVKRKTELVPEESHPRAEKQSALATKQVQAPQPHAQAQEQQLFVALQKPNISQASPNLNQSS